MTRPKLEIDRAVALKRNFKQIQEMKRPANMTQPKHQPDESALKAEAKKYGKHTVATDDRHGDAVNIAYDFEQGARWGYDQGRNEINTPEIADFIKAIQNEALHQRERWGSEHDAGKKDADWFWLVGYLAGKAIHSENPDKQLHHIITTAAACLNWHAARTGFHTAMRPGIEPPSTLLDDKPEGET